jgi:hypothetical protein
MVVDAQYQFYENTPRRAIALGPLKPQHADGAFQFTPSL